MLAPKVENKRTSLENAGSLNSGAKKRGMSYVDNRPEKIAQRKRRQTNNAEAEQTTQSNDTATGNPAGGEVVQRVVGSYKPGTLAVTTHAMRNLSLGAMKTVQQLHDDPINHYTIDQARQIATGVSTTSNPYEWDVTRHRKRTYRSKAQPAV